MLIWIIYDYYLYNQKQLISRIETKKELEVNKSFPSRII